MKIVVLGGGNSTEREVSLRSAKAVSNALIAAGFEVINLDPIDPTVLDSISPSTIVFPILHGNNGEDGVIQREMEGRNLSYLGSDSKTSRVCFDKGLAREAFQVAHLPIAKGAVVTKDTYKTHLLAQKPHVLKVAEGGSSIGTYIVHNPKKTDEKKVAEVFKLDEKAILEELIEGVEITVPILDGRALPVIEIKPPRNEEFDYLNKYNGKTQEICPPVSINKTTQRQAQQYAELAHKALSCRHLSRVDFIVKPDNSMVTLEINTMPGMTDRSLYPLGAQAAGFEFPKLMTKFVEIVKRDYGL